MATVLEIVSVPVHADRNAYPEWQYLTSIKLAAHDGVQFWFDCYLSMSYFGRYTNEMWSPWIYACYTDRVGGYRKPGRSMAGSNPTDAPLCSAAFDYITKYVNLNWWYLINKTPLTP